METDTTDKEGPDISWLLDWFKRDFVIILICLACLLGCLYTLYAVGSYQKVCNDYWQHQFDDCVCMKTISPFNQTFNYLGDYENG